MRPDLDGEVDAGSSEEDGEPTLNTGSLNVESYRRQQLQGQVAALLPKWEEMGQRYQPLEAACSHENSELLEELLKSVGETKKSSVEEARRSLPAGERAPTHPRVEQSRFTALRDEGEDLRRRWEAIASRCEAAQRAYRVAGLALTNFPRQKEALGKIEVEELGKRWLDVHSSFNEARDRIDELEAAKVTLFAERVAKLSTLVQSLETDVLQWVKSRDEVRRLAAWRERENAARQQREKEESVNASSEPSGFARFVVVMDSFLQPFAITFCLAGILIGFSAYLGLRRRWLDLAAQASSPLESDA